MSTKELLTEAEEAIEDARGLLDHLPPLSPDHETLRLAVVKLRRAHESIEGPRDPANKALLDSHDSIDEARSVIQTIRKRVQKRGAAHAASRANGDDATTGTAAEAANPITVFVDADTVLLATHQGRYGPELGLQGDVSEAIQRMFEIADRVVLLVNPSSRSSAHTLDTQHRLEVLHEGLDGASNAVVFATCVHGENGSCDCAKPGHGLITAHLESGRRAEDGWYIGGDQEGMVAGRSAGLHTIRIGPHGSDHMSVVHRPDFEARDLMDAANHIMVEVLTAP